MFTIHSGAAFGWSVTKAAHRPRMQLRMAPGAGTGHATDGTSQDCRLPTPLSGVKHHLSHSRQASSETEHPSTSDFLTLSALLGLGWATFLYVIKRRRLRRRLAALACALGPAVRPLEALHRR